MNLKTHILSSKTKPKLRFYAAAVKTGKNEHNKKEKKMLTKP